MGASLVASRPRQLAVTGLLAALALAGCGTDSYSGDSATSSAPVASSAKPTVAGTKAAAPAQVDLRRTGLGDVLVDSAGMTLYLYTKDTQGSGKSTCEGQCLAAWPALIGEPVAGQGVDATKLGTLTRTDGSPQVTYNGWPLYYWAKDKSAGDTTGQGVGKVWWVLDANGEAVGVTE